MLREVELRSQVSESNELRNSRYDERHINREIALTQRCDQLASLSCAFCAKEIECFTKCVIVSEFFREACSNCHHDSMRTRCTFHNDK